MMTMKPRNKNFGKSPFDPDYDDEFDYEEQLEEYLYWQELKDDERRCN